VEFDAVIERSDTTGSGSFVPIPFDVPAVFGTRGRVPVTATIDGVPYRGSIVAYGGPHLLIVLKDIQRQLNKGPGDTVHVALEKDTRERTVELGDEASAALARAGLLERFRSLSYSHQREYALWIDGAKRPETTTRRIARMIELLGEGRTLT
jgi:hypothetical protein